jgi:hypothetical protein
MCHLASSACIITLFLRGVSARELPTPPAQRKSKMHLKSNNWKPTYTCGPLRNVSMWPHTPGMSHAAAGVPSFASSASQRADHHSRVRALELCLAVDVHNRDEHGVALREPAARWVRGGEARERTGSRGAVPRTGPSMAPQAEHGVPHGLVDCAWHRRVQLHCLAHDCVQQQEAVEPV